MLTRANVIFLAVLTAIFILFLLVTEDENVQRLNKFGTSLLLSLPAQNQNQNQNQTKSNSSKFLSFDDFSRARFGDNATILETSSSSPEKVEELGEDETPDSGYDEFIGVESGITYYRKLANMWSRNGGSSGKEMQIFSAYHFKDHFAAVLAIGRAIDSVVFCRYIGKDGKEVAEPVESRVFPWYVVYCSRRNGTTMLGVTDRKTDPLSTKTTAKLIKRKFKEPKHHISFCLSPIYGDQPKWLHFVELVEHYKLQGVHKFFVYIQKISKYDKTLVDSYVKSGEVEIVDMSAVPKDRAVAVQMLHVADCHLRSRTYSTWSIFADLDERLMMTNESLTIDGFIKNLNNETIGSVVFPQRWIKVENPIPPAFQNDQQVLDTLPTRTWHETTSAAMKGHPNCYEQLSCWAKSIVNNQKAIRLQVHEVVVFYPGFREWFLDSSIGYIRHYRGDPEHFWKFSNLQKMKSFGPFSNTSFPESLEGKLTKNVLERLHRVYS